MFVISRTFVFHCFEFQNYNFPPLSSCENENPTPFSVRVVKPCRKFALLAKFTLFGNTRLRYSPPCTVLLGWFVDHLRTRIPYSVDANIRMSYWPTSARARLEVVNAASCGFDIRMLGYLKARPSTVVSGPAARRACNLRCRRISLSFRVKHARSVRLDWPLVLGFYSFFIIFFVFFSLNFSFSKIFKRKIEEIM